MPSRANPGVMSVDPRRCSGRQSHSEERTRRRRGGKTIVMRKKNDKKTRKQHGDAEVRISVGYSLFWDISCPAGFPLHPLASPCVFVSTLSGSFDVSHTVIGPIDVTVYRYSIVPTPNSILVRYATLQWSEYKRITFEIATPVYRTTQSAIYAARYDAAAATAAGAATSH